MFGVKASASIPRRQSIPAASYSARLSGAVSLGLGLVSVALVELLPFFLSDGPGVMLLIAAPLVAAAGFGLVNGLANLCTRIAVSAEGLVLTAPTWRLYPTLPLQRLEVSWREVRALRHRTEHYRVGVLRLGFAIEVYVVQTDRGSAVLGSYYLPELEAVLTDVANRAGCRWIDDGDVELGLLPTLWRGAPGSSLAVPRGLARE